MRPTTATFFSVLALAASQALARPTYYHTTAHRDWELDAPTLDSRSILDTTLLFDALAFPDPSNPANTIANFQAYVSLRSPDLGIVTAAVTSALSALGINVGNRLNTLQERVRLFGSVGLPAKKVKVVIPGCTGTVELPRTSLSDLGLASASVSLGSCAPAKEMQANVVPGSLDNRNIVASVFTSPNSGFGVISDIDDTIKISNVLNKSALLKSTFLEEPKVVPGMPSLYSSLSKSLQGPLFVYVSGSPYQLYPFLNKFIDTSYPDAKGPIFAQNLTILNIPKAIRFIAGNSTTFDHKVRTIEKLQSVYGKKKWLAIGDSTQKDPEVYAQIFKKFPGFITCIWIRRVEAAANSDQRFQAAFQGVPVDKIRVFTDADISGLAAIDVAGGKC